MERIPPLARAGAHPRPGVPFIRAPAAQIWLARIFDAPLTELESCSLPALVARAIVIVSGMAGGIDAIGHHGALASSGRAISVLGTGIDVCYPKENKKLYEKVLQRGAILSKFPLGTHPARMPRGVVIIEGAEFSGSLITSRLAMELGREVGIPGNVTQAVSYAPNLLIKQGAKLVVNAKT